MTNRMVTNCYGPNDIPIDTEMLSAVPDGSKFRRFSSRLRRFWRTLTSLNKNHLANIRITGPRAIMMAPQSVVMSGCFTL